MEIYMERKIPVKNELKQTIIPIIKKISMTILTNKPIPKTPKKINLSNNPQKSPKTNKKTVNPINISLSQKYLYPIATSNSTLIHLNLVQPPIVLALIFSPINPKNTIN
jgi:hypothetical protein